MDYKIEKNIRKPESNWAKYPFSEMKIGDSFLFLLENKVSVSTDSSQFGKRNKMKFSVRKNRIWRVK